ncbi:M85 family metallopeptidase [Caballeronia sp. LZ033]|uniref:M85 family metallopeptidase n=1 Tax=Caballeronia sp. LZ033 TaxID=3038566 RepID=UPI00285A5D95|nr:M85 family metallopeptidase [Caballeronia sp. LZ033]MDR5816445.1 M85 family metallopeptidase [Caballeronia sp. LZ033]
MLVSSATSGSAAFTTEGDDSSNAESADLAQPAEGASSTSSGEVDLPRSEMSTQSQIAPDESAPTRVKRDDSSEDSDDEPLAAADAYADHVVKLGQEQPLSATELNEARWSAVRSVQASHSMLADSQTADAIGNTILDALNRSPTFQSMVSYGQRHGGERLGDLDYRNEYDYRFGFHGEERAIHTMTADYLRRQSSTDMPLEVDVSAHSRDEYQPPWVNVGVVPNAGSPLMDTWRLGLIHELAHQLTDSEDPSRDSSEDRMGPTEILAYRVADELGWHPPRFESYGSEDRTSCFEHLERAALIDAAERNAPHARAFFERLEVLSERSHASPDFHELEEPAAGAAASDHTYFQPEPAGTSASNLSAVGMIPEAAAPHNVTQPLPEQPPSEDLTHVQFYQGEPFLFRFAQSTPLGPPTGFASAWAASSASWDTQGRFFRYGKPVDGNPHVRQFDFDDGSKVVISAHQPQLANSDGTNFEKGAIGVGAAVLGAVAGGVAGGPAGAVAGGSIGAAVGAAAAAKVPYDRIWQPYDINYYYKGAASPFYSQYMYPWDSNPDRVKLLTQLADPNLYPDYADSDPDDQWRFWRWRSGDTPQRT